jgi:hypothetical protein
MRIMTDITATADGAATSAADIHDLVAELVAYRLRVWRYAVDLHFDRGYVYLDTELLELGLPALDTDTDKAEVQIRAEVAARRTEDLADQLARFRDRVRRLAVRVAGREGYCSWGLNDALSNLGLPGYDGNFATITATVRLRDLVPDRAEPLTPATLTPLLRAESEDEDVEIVSAVVVDAVDRIEQDDALRITVRVRVRVDTIDQDEGADWATRFVGVRPYSEHVGLAADPNLSWALGDAATVAWDDDDPTN